MLTFYEFQSWVNFVLPLLASIAYLMRIFVGIKNKDTNRFRLMLPLFLLTSSGMAMIYLFNITGWWKLLEPDYESYSKIFVRPYFTFLGSVFFLSSWVHPELHPIIEQIRRTLWTLLRGLISKKS